MTIGFEILSRVPVGCFVLKPRPTAEAHLEWRYFEEGTMAGKEFHVPRDRDSGKMGTTTTLNRVGCGEQHHQGPLIKFLLDVAHHKKSCCGQQPAKI